jgi:hypothetical protein
MKYRFGGKEKLLSFGAYPAVSLAEARLCRAKAKVVLGEGGDPGVANKPRAQMTFEEAARKWHGHRLDALDAGHATRLLTRLKRDAFPVLGKLALGVITPTDVLAMVRRVETRGAPDVKRRYRRRSRIEIMFGRLKDWRRVATRYDRCPNAFFSAVVLAATIIFWL